MRAILAALLVALLVAGCSQEPPAPDPVPSPLAGEREPVCELRSGRHALTFAGQRREYLLAVPKRGRGPWPVVLNLHGLGSGAERQAERSRLPEQGARRGYLVVTPQVAPYRLAWTLPGYFGPDDTGYLGRLLDRLIGSGCARRDRQFAAGMSFGGAMALSLVCGMRGRLRAVAAVGGFNVVPPCAQAEPTTLVAVHGTADRTVPYRGGHPFAAAKGRLRAMGALVRLQSVDGSARRWARILDCRSRGRARPAEGLVLSNWSRCADGTRLLVYTVRGAGHVWPRPPALPDASRLILDVFDGD
ncbi:hypothetical protein [Nonomuraea longicatena]|uniref:PHB depolymerase family esterase n=1 Tax=Nonomuraea longicatena TaxID=83682 RepID=A0ABN1NWE6_9ACTN